MDYTQLCFIKKEFDIGVGRIGHTLPPHTLESLRNYVLEGTPTGHFLSAVLDNDLFEAFGRADPDNRKALHDIVVFVYNFCPAACRNRSEWINQDFPTIK